MAEQAVESTAGSGGALGCAAASSRPAPFRQHRRPVQTVSCITAWEDRAVLVSTPTRKCRKFACE